MALNRPHLNPSALQGQNPVDYQCKHAQEKAHSQTQRQKTVQPQPDGIGPPSLQLRFGVRQIQDFDRCLVQCRNHGFCLCTIGEPQPDVIGHRSAYLRKDVFQVAYHEEFVRRVGGREIAQGSDNAERHRGPAAGDQALDGDFISNLVPPGFKQVRRDQQAVRIQGQLVHQLAQRCGGKVRAEVGCLGPFGPIDSVQLCIVSPVVDAETDGVDPYPGCTKHARRIPVKIKRWYGPPGWLARGVTVPGTLKPFGLFRQVHGCPDRVVRLVFQMGILCAHDRRCQGSCTRGEQEQGQQRLMMRCLSG